MVTICLPSSHYQDHETSIPEQQLYEASPSSNVCIVIVRPYRNGHA